MLRAIDGSAPNANGKPAGSDMRIPNVTVAPGETQTIDLAKFFVNGESLTYVVGLAHAATEVAAVKIVDDTKLVVTGIANGTTTATITVNGGAKHVVAITVRKAGGNGWM